MKRILTLLFALSTVLSLNVAYPVDLDRFSQVDSTTSWSDLSLDERFALIATFETPWFSSATRYPPAVEPEELPGAFTRVNMTPIENMGRSNALMYLLDLNGELYLLRRSAGLFKGVDFYQENAIAVEMGRENGPAPRLHYSNPETGDVILSYINTLSKPKFSGEHLEEVPNLDESLMELLHNVHDTPPFTFESPDGKQRIKKRSGLDHAKMAQTFLDQAFPNKDFLSEQHQRDLNRIVDTANPSSGEDLTLIHGECNLTNFLYDGDELYMVDWEFAGLGHPFYDIACNANMRGKTSDEGIHLLQLYLKQTPSKKQVKQFQEFRRINFGFFAGITLLFSAQDENAKQPVDGERRISTFEEALAVLDDRDFGINPRNMYRMAIIFLEASRDY